MDQTKFIKLIIIAGLVAVALLLAFMIGTRMGPAAKSLAPVAAYTNAGALAPARPHPS